MVTTMKALRLIRKDGEALPRLVLEHVPKTYPDPKPSHRQTFTQDGFQAEYCLVPENAVAPKPEGLSFTQAACVGVPFTTASLVLSRAHAKKDETVLVTGANGAVGSAVVQLAKSMGCRVLSATRSNGDDVNTATDPELRAVDILTNGKGVDVVADTVGQPALLQAAINKLTRGGRLSFIASPRDGDTGLMIDMLSFYRGEKALVGCNTLTYDVEELAKQLKNLEERFDRGLLKGSDEGSWTEVKLENGVEAYEKASLRRAGKFHDCNAIVTLGCGYQTYNL
ncbi:hypothetical protein DID88_002648 [Monilinia fructigena]|uniref:Enoyl reductase (ER) domain-containing protein n=1 Tax=Monilinia fructigena TaxID=38457 RepID=A0A395IQJ6_9HELO|nr:hypothetical protein DID88_002648 [Monilinia fructigena]